MPLTQNVEVVRGSICDADVVRKALKSVQRLYHLAAKQDLEVIVYTSVGSILTGNARRGTLVNTAVVRKLSEMPGPCCHSKFLAEQEAFKVAQKGLLVVMVALNCLSAQEIAGSLLQRE